MYRSAAFFVLVALISSALGGPTWKKVQAYRMECARMVGIDLASTAGPSTAAKPDFLDDPKTRCFVACMMNKMGNINDDGTVNIEKLIQDIRPSIRDYDTLVAFVKDCAAKKGETECDTTFAIFKCLRNKEIFLQHRRNQTSRKIEKNVTSQ